MNILDTNESKKLTEKQIKEIDDKINESRGAGWWDGPQKYQYVNRNPISACQRDTLFLITQAMCKHLGGKGLGIGGSPIDNVLTVNVDNNCDIKVTDYHLPVEDNSVPYIISSHSLEHIPPNPFTVISEWIRVLKPNGLIACTLPDKTYFQHENRDGISTYDYAHCEVSASELKVYLDMLIDKVDILIFDTNKNNFDINFLLRKKE